MVDAIKSGIRRVLRIPPQPDAPFGAPGSVRVFRAGLGFLRYRLLQWLAQQAGVLSGIVFFLIFSSWDPIGMWGLITGALERVVPWPLQILSITQVLWAIEIFAIAAFLIQFPFSLVFVLLDYECRWYIVTDRSLRIREGLFRVDERTMTFSNIQNLSVRQGPLQRLFGISDLEVRTAGGSEGSDEEEDDDSKSLHVARFRGIANPEEVRDAIRKHLETQQQSGLGDPDEPPPERPVRSRSADAELATVKAAARSVLAEVRALRAALSRGSAGPHAEPGNGP